MQKHSKCITFLICLQFSIINILYLNTILKPKQVIWQPRTQDLSCYLVGKAVVWRPLAFIYWQFFQPVIWRVADLPAFAFDAFR